MAEPVNTTIQTPDITGVINQQFFIEPQGGPKHPVSYLDRFPSSLYNKGLDSNLVALMYTLLGPAGIGSLKKNYLDARLAIEDNGLRTTDLDALYANPFSFARLALETYEDNTEGLLSNAQWEQIQASDASYKNRAINYLAALRAGGTLLGITLAAKSGLNRAVEVVENYRALYDKYSDSPLELEQIGVTDSTEEVILLPRQERPQSSQQTLAVLGNPITGQFRLALPLGANGEGGAQNNTTTGLLPFNVTSEALQGELEKLGVIGAHNVEVTGGPFPGNPLIINFTRELADRSMPAFLVTTNTLANNEAKLTVIEVIVDTVGASADGEVATVPPEDWYYAQVAIENIKPMTTIVTPGKAPGITKRQPVFTSFADSEFVEVLRYVTGRRGVPWPPVDDTNWIEAGVEREAPKPLNAELAHYINFHNISTAVAYTGAALLDPAYETSGWPAVREQYKDEHTGEFSRAQKTLYPFLNIPVEPLTQFYATDAPASQPELPTAQNHAGETLLISGVYPVNYAAFAQVSSTPSETTLFWSSNELAEGTDYLEIDLGRVQAVNAIFFEASNKPYEVGVSYDLLDAAPQRRFIAANFADPREAESIRTIGYSATEPNQWEVVGLHLTNSLGSLIFTRFIRLEFTRRTGPGSPFANNNENLPYSIEIRNLRIGRNIAPQFAG